MGSDSEPRIKPCLRCLWYAVSWDPAFPHSCRQFGIKSRELPSVSVLRNTGQPCPSWEINPRIQRRAPSGS